MPSPTKSQKDPQSQAKSSAKRTYFVRDKLTLHKQYTTNVDGKITTHTQTFPSGQSVELTEEEFNRYGLVVETEEQKKSREQPPEVTET